jgi:hypothetical protein
MQACTVRYRRALGISMTVTVTVSMVKCSKRGHAGKLTYVATGLVCERVETVLNTLYTDLSQYMYTVVSVSIYVRVPIYTKRHIYVNTMTACCIIRDKTQMHA